MMASPLSTAYQVRLRIQDLPRAEDITLHGDGTATRFTLDHRNLSSASAYVPLGGTAWTATGATFNASGFVDFSNVISANSAYRLTYVRSVFSDNEIGHFTAVGGSVPGAALEAVRALRFDSLRRAKWASPDGTEFDDTMAQQTLKEMEEALKEERDEGTLGGSLLSWGETQEDYS